MIIVLSLLIALIGGVIYLVSANPKLAELGRLAFFAGLLAFLITVHVPLQLMPGR
jgi:hypothetical protein